MTQPTNTTTLIVSQAYSKCSACGGYALPAETTHDVNVSFGQPVRPGCGAQFTAITTDQDGYGVEAALRAMLTGLRPDLPIVEFGGHTV